LIIEMMALRLMAETRVRERFREEERIAEFVFDALFERIHSVLGEKVCLRAIPTANGNCGRCMKTPAGGKKLSGKAIRRNSHCLAEKERHFPCHAFRFAPRRLLPGVLLPAIASG
jgi:hypothetical protein